MSYSVHCATVLYKKQCVFVIYILPFLNFCGIFFFVSTINSLLLKNNQLKRSVITLKAIYGACAYDHKKERYVIYYNDTKKNEGLTRFTIAHELGHIFLEHHKRADTDIMLRKGISASVYKAFENGANCFARNFLSPQPLVPLVTDITQDYSIDEIKEAFNISHDAAITRRKLFKNNSY